MKTENVAWFIFILLFYLTTHVIFHGMPEFRVKDRILEWYGWLGTVGATAYVLSPYKVLDPGIPLLGHLDNVTMALIIAFSAMTAGSARQRWKSRRDKRKQRDSWETPDFKKEPLTVVLS